MFAAFAEDGPHKCSGLEVERYSLEKMADIVGLDFDLIMHLREEHKTPFGTTQSFQYALFRYIPSGDG